MAARTVGSITIGPDSSQKAGYWFMRLNTGRRIHRRRWTPLLTPDEVASRVGQLGKNDGQSNFLVFTNWHGEDLLDGVLDDDGLSYATVDVQYYCHQH